MGGGPIRITTAHRGRSGSDYEQEVTTGYQGVWRDKCSTSGRRFIAEVNLSSAEQKRLVVSHSLLSLGTFDTAVKGAVSHARFRLVCATPSPPQPIMCRARGAELDRARVQRGRWRRIRGALRSVPSLIVR